jgi:uncharacterized protein (DUF2147 family)
MALVNKTSVLRTLMGAAALTVAASAAYAADPTGTWVRPSTGTVVKFYNCGSNLCAKIVGVKDKSKQGTVGTVIMSGASKSGEGTWKGDLLNTEDGQTYSGVVTYTGGGLTLKGCVLGGIVCKGETWSRVN